MPCGVTDFVGWAQANLVNGVDGKWWLTFPSSQVDIAPSPHVISILSLRFHPSYRVSSDDHGGASWEIGAFGAHVAGVDL